MAVLTNGLGSAKVGATNDYVVTGLNEVDEYIDQDKNVNDGRSELGEKLANPSSFMSLAPGTKGYQRQAKRLLLDVVNQFIKISNTKKFRRGYPMRDLLSARQIDQAVCIARRPGPFMEFEAGDLDTILVMAGFKPKR
jgi:hypothetical protein